MSVKTVDSASFGREVARFVKEGGKYSLLGVCVMNRIALITAIASAYIGPASGIHEETKVERTIKNIIKVCLKGKEPSALVVRSLAAYIEIQARVGLYCFCFGGVLGPVVRSLFIPKKKV